jgi:hypothetical protein
MREDMPTSGLGTSHTDYTTSFKQQTGARPALPAGSGQPIRDPLFRFPSVTRFNHQKMWGDMPGK